MDDEAVVASYVTSFCVSTRNKTPSNNQLPSLLLAEIVLSINIRERLAADASLMLTPPDSNCWNRASILPSSWVAS